jgi:Ser/Thr protein kinase RdoA (MazF antagonist)
MNNDAIAARYMPAAVEALKAFPINPSRVELVLLSENVTFCVTNGDDGAPYVLRLHRPGYHTLAGLNSERVWTGALAEAGIATQAPVLTHDACYFHQVDIPNTSEQRYAGMTEWVEGTVISDYLGDDASLEERKRCFHQIGALAGTIHNQSSSWTPPAGFERPSYDTDGLLGEAPLWGRFWEHPGLDRADTELLLRTRSQIRKVLKVYQATSANYGMIHADLDPANVLVQDGRVTLIDFDDAGYGWHLYELSAAVFSEIEKPGFPDICQALVAGYRDIRALSERDLELLPMFLLIRGMVLIGWISERPEIDNTDFFREVKEWVLASCASFSRTGPWI